MIFFAKYLFLAPILLFLFYFLKQGRQRQKEIFIFAALSLPLTFFAAKILGHFYYDPRPFVTYHFTPLVAHEANNGFPSDHALLSFALSSLIFVFSKKLGLILGVFGILVSASRIYVGIHSPIDIVGSFFIAVSIAYLIHKLGYNYLFYGQNKRLAE